MSNRVHTTEARVYVSYGYIRPRRSPGGYRRYTAIMLAAGIVRPWVRYLIVQTVLVKVGRSVKHSRTQMHPVALVWTRRQAERLVAELRRSA